MPARRPVSLDRGGEEAVDVLVEEVEDDDERHDADEDAEPHVAEALGESVRSVLIGPPSRPMC